MVSHALPANRERAAWTVLLTSFATFITLAATLVFGGRWWLLTATRSHEISQVPSGTVQVTQPGRTNPEVGLQIIPVGSVIATEANAQTSLTFAAPDSRQVLATVQVFGNTQIKIDAAESPRFATGPAPHHIVLHVTTGRVAVYVGVQLQRPVEIEILTETGAVTRLVTPGSIASVEAMFTETVVTVREGQAVMSAQGASVGVARDERAEVVAGAAPQGPLPAERNLISSGDFSADLASTWQIDIRRPADLDESPGTVEPMIIGGRRTVKFERPIGSVNWGQVGIQQTIDRDVRGYSSLRLHMDLMITEQQLPNCGINGTECPAMVKITYVDEYGSTYEWLHGFYFNFDPNPARGSTRCMTCWPQQWEHDAWPKASWQVYDSPNLLEIFGANNTPPAIIKTINIYASGWAFTAYITNVQLLAE